MELDNLSYGDRLPMCTEIDDESELNALSLMFAQLITMEWLHLI